MGLQSDLYFNHKKENHPFGLPVGSAKWGTCGDSKKNLLIVTFPVALVPPFGISSR